jgi:hypothetical protein
VSGGLLKTNSNYILKKGNMNQEQCPLWNSKHSPSVRYCSLLDQFGCAFSILFGPFIYRNTAFVLDDPWTLTKSKIQEKL